MEINKENYKTILLEYLEDTLTMAERREVEAYMRQNQDAAREWELLKLTRLKPDTSIVFPRKDLLFRTEADAVQPKRTVVIGSLYRYAALAAAAAVLTFVVIFSLRKPAENAQQVAHASPIQNGSQQATGAPGAKTGIVNKNSAPAMPSAINPQNLASGAVNAGKKTLKPGNSFASASSSSQKEPQKTGNGNQAQEKQPEPKYATRQNPDIQKPNTPAQELQPAPRNETAQNNSNNTQTPARAVQQQQPKPTIKYAANTKPAQTIRDTRSKTLLGSVLDIFHHVAIKKEEEKNQTYYALSIETSDIKIDKSFK